ISIPDETTFGRLFRTFKQSHINQIETLVHFLRDRAWGLALRNGKSIIAAKSCHMIDVDSTEKTAYGTQEGVACVFRRIHPVVPVNSTSLKSKVFSLSCIS
ncbi:hypothetical protein K8T06_11270, partial [bacterium]|nr:hypothetical protein [bacterium]